jgi:glycosyltransferase involved in cell wall biosynthesis
MSANDRIKVMMTTEGTYPFHQGGVSTWCHTLIHRLTDIDYVIFSVVMNPFASQKFRLPKNSELIKVPLWGTEEPSEHLSTPFSEVYLAKKRTDDRVVKEHFIPLFSELVDEILSNEKDASRFGKVLLGLYKYFREYEYKNSFKCQLTWEVFKQKVCDYTSVGSNRMAQPNVYSLIQSIGWLYRFLNILNTPLPDVHVTHSAAAAFCGIPCVVAKLDKKVPFLLTEHGVYLREQYLSLAQRGYSSYLNTFLMRMIHSVTNINYEYADQVSPVCMYNTRWEKKFGVPAEKIKVIYNGVDKNVFTPAVQFRRGKYPTVVTVARIDPIKDIMTLLRAAAIVKDRIPDVRFIVYGSVSVPDYYEQCLSLRDELGLNENFIFAGHTSDVPKAYHSGDVVALCSISEAFPYSVVEAMMEGKACIATDVGGIREALGETGIVVTPRQPDELAGAITFLLENPEIRESLGEEARHRALNYFTLDRVIGIYLKSYINLAIGQRDIEETEFMEDVQLAVPYAKRFKRQKLFVDRAYALMELGYMREAILQFRKAVKEDPNSPAVPVILTEIAKIYNSLGEYDLAFYELERAEAIAEILRIPHIA